MGFNFGDSAGVHLIDSPALWRVQCRMARLVGISPANPPSAPMSGWISAISQYNFTPVMTGRKAHDHRRWHCPWEAFQHILGF
jgi:hypothetical protein